MRTHQVIVRIRTILIVILIRSNILLIASRYYRNPLKAVRAVKTLAERRALFSGFAGSPKFFFAGGRFFFNPNVPGWPSLSFSKFIENELRTNNLASGNHQARLTSIIFSITSKCHLKCLHCFEWDRLNGSEHLSSDDLITILKKFQQYGVCQVQLGGGEPMLRFNELIRLIESSEGGTDFWLLTSGYNLTEENAVRLKKSGLTGVRISLDHWDREKHNAFRGSDKAYHWALEAAKNCRKAGLAMGLAACITKEFLSEENLYKYLYLAQDIKADFVFLLEPRETGHFSDMEVTLSDEEAALVERFYLRANSQPLFSNLPQIIFPGYHQRKIGCFGAGIRFLYVDSEGSVHACPFCQGKIGDAVKDDLYKLIPDVRKKGCQMFHPPAGAIS